MASLGDLVVSLQANNAHFQKNVKQSQTTLQKFGSYAKGAFAGAVAAGFASAAGSVYVLMDQMQELDKLAKSSAKLGIDVDQLQALQFAAEQTGTSAGVMETALQRMTRRVSEAAQGSGSAVKAIKELGLSAQQLATMTPDQQMREFADAMQDVETQGDRVRLAMALFDTEGVALVNTLAAGAAGLDAYHQEMEQMGGLFTADELSDIEAANDAINRLSHRVSAMAASFTVEAAGSIESFVNTLNKLDVKGKHVAQGLQEMLVFAAGPAAGALWSAVPEAPPTPAAAPVTDAANAMSDLAAEASNVVEPVKAIDDLLLNLGRQVHVLRGAMSDIDMQLLDAWDKGATEEQLEKLRHILQVKKQLEDAAKAQADQQREAERQAQQAQRAEEQAARKKEQAQNSFNTLLKDTRTDLRVQLGLMSEIDAKVQAQRDRGIGSAQLAQYRELLEAQAELEATKQQIGQPVRGGVLAERGSEKAFKIIATAGKDQKLLKESQKHTKKLADIAANTKKRDALGLIIQGPV